MYSLKKTMGGNNLYWKLSVITKILSCYLILSSCPKYYDDLKCLSFLGDQSIFPEIEHKQSKKIEEKLLLDLSKRDVLHLVNEDLLVHISLDKEGKVIGYRPLVTKMPNYWNSEITKRLLRKNNLFSLSYQKDQITSIKISLF